jgi:hypothetical protein
MCFSAPASFVSSAALIPAGVYCVSIAIRKDHSHLPLAAIPFFFGVQQFCEGLVWVGFDRHDAILVQRASVAYLFFAIALWPFWIPLSFLCTDTRKKMRLFLGLLMFISLAWTGYFLPMLLEPQRWVAPEVHHHSIRYETAVRPGDAIASPVVWSLSYLLVVAIPLFVGAYRWQDNPRGKLLSLAGVFVLVASFALSSYWFWYAFTSIWCFFAALVSLFLCYVFSQLADTRHGMPASVHP